jgi:hypothetical protein
MDVGLSAYSISICRRSPTIKVFTLVLSTIFLHYTLIFSEYCALFLSYYKNIIKLKFEHYVNSCFEIRDGAPKFGLPIGLGHKPPWICFFSIFVNIFKDRIANGRNNRNIYKI